MKKISDFKNEKGLELLADLMESVSKILADREIVRALFAQRNLYAIRLIARDHKNEALDLLAYFNGVSKDEYSANAIQMGKELFEILSDEDIAAFFTLPPSAAEDTSGDVTEVTPETDEE